MGYHSTALSIASRHCPRALDFFEANAPRADKDMFQAGIAAHAVLQAVGELLNKSEGGLLPDEEERAAREVCERMIRDGRSFAGKQEPPMDSAAVWQGRDIAFDFLAMNPLRKGWEYEIGLAVDADWNPVPFGRGAWLSAILDCVGEDWSEEHGSVLVVRDYKTSWAAGYEELETVQRRIQGVLGYLCLKGQSYGAIVLEIVNLRTGKTYSEVAPNAAGGRNLLIERWKEDIAAEIRAREGQKRLGARPAVPGPRCFGCPYLPVCLDARAQIEHLNPFNSPQLAARAYAVGVAWLANLRKWLEPATKDQAIEVKGGRVGRNPTEISELKEDAYSEIWGEWAERGKISDVEPLALGLLCALKLTKTQAESVARKLWPRDRARQDEWLATLTTKKIQRKFGVQWEEMVNERESDD